MAAVGQRERAPLPTPSQPYHTTDYSLTEVSFVLHDLSWRSADGSQTDPRPKLENEVMVDPWSSMDSTNSPLTDSGPSASDDCPPSTSSETRGPDAPSPLSPPCRTQDKDKTAQKNPNTADKSRPRDLNLDLENLDTEPSPRRPHFLDQSSPTTSNLECRIPKPHFLDHVPSPDEAEERSDITNPNFLDDDILDDNAQKKSGALPKKSQKPSEDRPRTSYRSSLHYGLESAARSNERTKRASQLYTGTWPGERDWAGQDSGSVRSFSSNGSDGPRPSSNLENKMECVYSLLSLLTLSPDNNADLSGPLLEMSRSVESCIAMRQAGCIPLLVQLIHSKLPRETRDRAAKALRNIIHTQTDDKAGRREARVWRLLEQVREYCYALEDLVENRKEEKEITDDDTTKHPSQSVAALMKLSFDEEHRHVVCQLGGLQTLAALVSGDQAAHGSRTDDNTCLTMRKYAGMTLTNLTFGDGNNKSLLCSFKDFMMALVEQLESPNDDMRQVTAAVLRNLSWRADTNSKQVLREVGAVKGLTKAAMTCQKEATLKSVLSALWNLTAHCSMNKVALCSVDGALGFLVDMLSYNSPTKTLAIVENAGGIIRNVSSHIAIREDYRQILRERNCLGVLLQHLKSPSLTVVSNSCGTLWNLSARCPQDQQYLWDQAAVPMLRSLIHSKHKMIAMGSSAALKNLLNSKPGKSHIMALDATARNMNLPALPTLGVRKQKALEQELDQNLAETCDNIEPATSPSTSNREEKNLFTATERQMAINLERHRMTSSSPLMGTLSSQISLSHSAHLSGYMSCSNTLLKGSTLVARSSAGSAGNVNRSDSKDSVTSTHSDTVFEKVMRTGKVPVPTPRNKDLMKDSEGFKVPLKKEGTFNRYPLQPPIPPPRNTEMRTNYTESGYDVDQDSCDQPIDFSQKYSETKSDAVPSPSDPKKEAKKKKDSTFGDYQETDLDQPTDYSLRYAEHQSETGSDVSEPVGPSIHEDTIKHFATEGTPYETPIIFSTATSMSDLRVIGKDGKPKTPNVKEEEVMTLSDEKDTCSIEEPARPDNDTLASELPVPEEKRGQFDTKFSSGMITPEKPVSYCEEGTPGVFSRVSSLSSLGEPTEEDCLAKKNAMATINIDPGVGHSVSFAKDKEGSKAVTFACDSTTPTGPEQATAPTTPGVETPSLASGIATPGIVTSGLPLELMTPGLTSGVATPGLTSGLQTPGCVEDTPLMFSRSSSLGSLPDCGQPDDRGDVLSEVSRLTSGCISPSEIPDSPGASAAVSPRPPRSPLGPLAGPPTQPATPPHEAPLYGTGSVFAERATLFGLEDTPALLSGATSLSSLTIDDYPKARTYCGNISSATDQANASSSSNHTALDVDGADHSRLHNQSLASHIAVQNDSPKEDSCQVYITEDTPAVLSKAGSHSNLSALSALSELSVGNLSANIDNLSANLSANSSEDSDANDLLQECIMKGIAKVVKNKEPSEAGSAGFSHGPYRSLPPYLRSSTETVKMSQEYGRTLQDSAPLRSPPPPPLPPKSQTLTPPPRPAADGRKLDSRLPITSTLRSKPAPGPLGPRAAPRPLRPRTDSLSSLDSFGSTDQEIFQAAVTAGIARTKESKAHSVDRTKQSKPIELPKHVRQHRSLDRSDKIHRQVYKPRDDRQGAFSKSPMKRLEHDFSNLSMSRSPYSYHGDTSASSLAPRARAARGSRPRDDGPPSLPTKMEFSRLERSNSLSSLSNDSFGSTDREVFERCVKMGMTKGQPKKREDKRVRSDDRLEVRDLREHRSRRRQKQPNALDRMVGERYSKDRAILEEVIARGAGERAAAKKEEDKPGGIQSKNVAAPSAERASAGGNAAPAPTTGCDSAVGLDFEKDLFDSCQDTSECKLDGEAYAECKIETSNAESGNTTFESAENEMDQSNEFLAHRSINTTLDSEAKDELNRSNESYADVLDGSSWSDVGSPGKFDAGTLTRKKKHEWTDIKVAERDNGNATESESHELQKMKRSTDTWNDNTCPDDVTFPTISGSVHFVASISEMTDPGVLPDLLAKSERANMSFARPDLTNKLDSLSLSSERMLDAVPEPSFHSIIDDEPKFDPIITSEIEKEAARLALQLKNSNYAMENSVTSLTSLDLDNIRPPSNLGSLLSLSASGHIEESTTQVSKKSRSRKQSLPVALMVKRALSNSQHQGSSEHLDSNPVSFLENVKPPSEMEHLDMESSMVSVSSIVSEVVESRERTPVVFDFKQPVHDFPMSNTLTTVFQDLDKVNPPSLFDEMAESTMEVEPTTAQLVYEDCVSNTLNVVTDIPSGSETCTPLPSDVSSVESTPKRQRDPKYLTPKEKRQLAKDRYQTYTITDTLTGNTVESTEEFLTWTRSESDSRSDEYVTAHSEAKSKRRISAKQRRLEDRARYQTQTVDISVLQEEFSTDPQIESLKQRLASKKTIKQKRMEDAERFRTRTLSEDIPPSPTFVTRDANFENVETTTGYDSLSSNEHQLIIDERQSDDVFAADADSGHNEDFVINPIHMQTFTKSFRKYLPADPTAADLCVVNNLKNIEMTASYQRALQIDAKNHPSSSDFASYEGDSNSDDKVHSDSEPESPAPAPRPKPKITKPGTSRDESLDSNDSRENDEPKAIRGRKKALYVSPYRRTAPAPKKTIAPAAKVSPKVVPKKSPAQPQTSRAANKTPGTSKASSASTSPKKTPPKSPAKIAQRPSPVSLPMATVKPLPLERQGTFVKEESSTTPKNNPTTERKFQTRKATTPTMTNNVSPSRLPQLSRYTRPQLRKANSNESKPGPSKRPAPNRSSAPVIRSSASNHSLQSNDSGKTVTLARGSRAGSSSSVNSVASKTKDVESKIAGLWKKVEQCKKQPNKPDKRVWIESEKKEPPKLIRSSTFDGQPQPQVSTAPKQKTAIGIRVTQIPLPKGLKVVAPAVKKTVTRVFAKKQVNGQT